MMNLEELKTNRQIVNQIDWGMTPEKAISMYLEWGAGWTRDHDFVSYHGQESIYFVLFDFEDPPQVTLIKRNMKDAVEIAKIPVPKELFLKAWQEDGSRNGVGVHNLNKELKEWLCEAIDGPPLEHQLEDN